jgi:predicted SprT family Zn-dependent metalloprotease
MLDSTTLTAPVALGAPRPETVSAHLHARIEAEVKRSMDLASAHYGRDFDYPRIDYSLRGLVMGKALVWENVICLNRVMLLSNVELVMSQTIAHEAAHLIDYALHPKNFSYIPGVTRCSFHGPTWREIMRVLDRAAIRVLLEVDITYAQVRVLRKHLYTCGECGSLTACGKTAHGKIQNGASFTAVRCGHAIDPKYYQGLTPDTLTQLENRARGAAL